MDQGGGPGDGGKWVGSQNGQALTQEMQVLVMDLVEGVALYQERQSWGRGNGREDGAGWEVTLSWRCL